MTRFLDWLCEQPYEFQVIVCGLVGGLSGLLVVIGAILLFNTI